MNGLRAHARDPDLPRRAGEPALSPPEPVQVLELVARHLVRDGAPVPTEATWTYARWKPHTALACGYELAYADGTTRWVHVKRYAGDKAAHLLGREAGAAAEGWEDALLAPGAALPDAGLLLTVHPADRELPGLARALDLRRTTRRLNAAGLHPGARMRSARSTVRLLRLRPESRAVLRLDAAWTDAQGRHGITPHALRVLPPERAARVARARRACSAGDLLPELQAHEERTGLLVEAWHDVDVPAPDRFDHAERAGEALARLHAVQPGPPSLPAVTRRDPRLAWAGLFGWHASLARRSEPLVPAPRRGALVWSHGDLHPDQVVRRRVDGATLLLDLDRLGPAPAARDLASWIADRLAEEPGTSSEDAAAALLAGYARGGGRVPAARELAAHAAEALVERAAAGLRRLERGAVERAERLLAAAHALHGEASRTLAPGAGGGA